MDLGIDGFLLKEDCFDDILTAIKTVMDNKIFISKKINSNSISCLLTEKLTNREFEIFKLLAIGVSIKDISQKLHISVKTVDTHKARIMRKFDILVVILTPQVLSQIPSRK